MRYRLYGGVVQRSEQRTVSKGLGVGRDLCFLESDSKREHCGSPSSLPLRSSYAGHASPPASCGRATRSRRRSVVPRRTTTFAPTYCFWPILFSKTPKLPTKLPTKTGDKMKQYEMVTERKWMHFDSSNGKHRPLYTSAH